MSKRILIISQYHTPEIGAAATRWRDYATILSAYGFEVMVLSEIPNYPAGAIYGEYRYFRPVREKSSDGGYEIVRVPVWVNPRKTTIQRLGFYFSFVISALVVLKKLPKFEHVIVSSPPLTVGIIGYIIKKFLKTQMTMDIRDLWPESAITLGELKLNIAKNTAFWLEKLLYDTSDGFFVAVPGFKVHLRTKIPEKEIISLPNGVSSSFLKTADKCSTLPGQKFRILFSGNIGLAQDLENVIKSAELLRNYEIEFIIIGNGAKRDEIRNYAFRKNLGNIVFSDPVDQKTLINEIKLSSVCIVPLIRSELFHNAIPSKMIEYMACSRPVIATIKGEAQVLLELSKAGIVSDPGDPDMLAASILHYYENREDIMIHGNNGRTHVGKTWIKENLSGIMIRYLEK